MNQDLFDLLYKTFGSTIDDIIDSSHKVKLDTFSHSIKLSSCMMEFLDYLRMLPTDKLEKKIKHKNRTIFINYIKNLTFPQYDKLMVMCWWHDIGKTKVEKSILTKPGKLTKKEYSQISKHAEYGADILKGMGFDSEIIFDVLFHHPKNISKKNLYSLVPAISLLEITDIYTALREPRIYREDVLTLEESLMLLKKELKTNSGIGNPFIELFEEFVTQKETTGYNIFTRFDNITIEDIISRSMHYTNKKNISDFPSLAIS